FDKDHRTRVVARPHKEKLRACILRLCREAKVPRADVLARQLFLLVEGAIVAAMIEPKSTAAADARSVAAALRKAHANEPSARGGQLAHALCSPGRDLRMAGVSAAVGAATTSACRPFATRSPPLVDKRDGVRT